jgi:hypothetical protein
MSMTYLQQIAVMPALLLTLASLLALHGPNEEKGKRRFLLFLLVIGVLLLTAVFLTNQPPGAPYNSLSFQLPTLLTPAIAGVLALILLNLKSVGAFNRREKMTAGLLGLAMLILFGLLWNSRLSIAYLILPGAVALAIAWQLSNRYRRLAVFLSLYALAALFFYNYLFQYQPDPASYVWLRFLLLPAFFIAPALLVGMPALFITMQMQQGTDGKPSGWVNPVRRTKIARLSLTFLLLGSLLYFLFWWAVWDQTQDMGIGFLALPMVGVTAVVAGMIMTTTLSGKHRIVGLLFMVLVPTLLYQVYELGHSISHHEITESRAGQIAEALDQFQAREGYYPETLAALRPRDLLFIWQPVILPGETWCYQGGADFYRLAAFHREFFSSPVSLRVYEAAGEPPSGSWECEAQLAAMKERYSSPMEDPAAFQPPMPTPLPEIEVGMPKTAVQPVLDGLPVAVGSWSPDGRYFVFGAKNGPMTAMTLHFLNGQTGEICTANGDFSYMERLHQHHVWLPDGESEATSDRLLFLDANGEMIVFTPCQPEGERLKDRFSETFTKIGGRGEANGRILLQSEAAFWILDGRSFTLQPISDVTPNLYDLHWDQAAWLPGGERLVISRLDDRSGSNAGATLYLVDGSSGQVETSLHMPGDFGQSAPWVEGLSEAEILLHSSGDWLIVDFSASPPQFTNVLADIFNLDVDFPDEISASGSFVDKDGSGYYLAVRLNHPRNQAVYLYHATTGQVHVYDHEHHTLLLLPDGELWEMAKQEGEPTYRDEYDLVLAAEPQAAQPRLFLSGHTPREYPHLSIRYLVATSQIAVASAHGISLVSLPDGKMTVYWDLVGDGFSPWLLPAPDGSALVAAKDLGGLYYLPRHEE